MTLQEIKQLMTSHGARVVGTISEFYGKDPMDVAEGLWISAEDTPRLFDYYEGWPDTLGINPKMNELAEENGWYFEWYDAGTLFLIQD